METSEATYTLERRNGALVLALGGDWTVWTIGPADEPLRALAARLSEPAFVDLGEIGRLDVSGAYLIERTIRAAPGGAALQGGSDNARKLIETARASFALSRGEHAPQRRFGLRAGLERIGRGAAAFSAESLATLSFLGETLATLAALAARPHRIRWISVVAILEQAGLDALPIIATLSFFVGLVIAYVGVSVLADFGATVFTVELVGFSVLREFAVVITAVLLAGRTDSAFTAEIGAIKMRQEIDAMRVLGLDVMERLVAPRVMAMTIAAPLLTFVAMLTGLAGGMLVAWANLGVSPILFVSRIQEGVGEVHFWIGLSKAPVFGFVLAIVGCRHGLKVGGDVASLGRQTTASVVQAIFLVIVLDAIFALWYLELDL